MLNHLARNWWAVALRGLVAILFGIVAFVLPGLTLEVLVLIFGAYAFVDGVFEVVGAFINRAGHDRWWVLLLEGVVSIVAGLVVFFRPGLATLALLYVIAAWAVVTGLLEIAAAVRLRREMQGEWMLALSGIASIVFGVLVAIFPIAAAITVAWLIGAYAIVFGIVLLVLAIRLRSWASKVQGGMAASA